VARIVVIGAGVGGLAAAARLAATGHDVTVCEQGPDSGGKLGRFEQDGFVFDTGPSLLTMPDVFEDLFRATGDPLDQMLTLRPVEPIARHVFADGSSFDSSANLDLHCAGLDAAFGAGSGDAWRQFMARAERIHDATRGPFLESPLHGALTLARLALHDPLAIGAVAPHQSLRRLGAKYLTDPRLRMMLDRYATYTGSDPRKAPAALAVIPWVEQTFGAWYLDGGLTTLGAAIADRAVERGARLRFGAEVTQITTSQGKVDGVLLADGGRIPADVVVANADAAEVYDRLLAPAVRRRARSPWGVIRGRMAAGSLSGFVMLLGLEGRTPGLTHHTVLFPGSRDAGVVDYPNQYDAEFDAIFGQQPRPVPDPTLYIAAPDDPSTRPDENSESWFVLVNAPRHGSGAPGTGTVNWREPGLADSYADNLMQLLADRGFDITSRIRMRALRTPADLAEQTRAPGGAIYGAPSHGPRAAFLRPANRSRLPGLFLVGGSAHPGGGLPLVTLSAQITAAVIGPAR
jgi:phytoene desaturase